MIPVSDAARSRTVPYVNVAIIISCVIIWLYELTLSQLDINRFFIEHGVIPARLSAWLDQPSGIGEPLTVVTSAFIHAGWLHLGGNMIFLWVFGDNVEDALGHAGYLLFYLVSAVGAVALEVYIDSGSVVPMVGASGAIAGVLGAYLVLHASATVDVIIPWIWFFGTFKVPAAFMIGFWFLLQLANGIATIGTSGASSGVAVWAHVGGFGTGFVILLALRPFIRRPPPRSRGTSVW